MKGRIALGAAASAWFLVLCVTVGCGKPDAKPTSAQTTAASVPQPDIPAQTQRTASNPSVPAGIPLKSKPHRSEELLLSLGDENASVLRDVVIKP